MGKFNEILNSSDASDALLGEQIDALDTKIENDIRAGYAIEWENTITVVSCTVSQTGKNIQVSALITAKSDINSGDTVFTIKRPTGNARCDGRNDLICVWYPPVASTDAPVISGIYSGSTAMFKMNNPGMKSGKNYFIIGNIKMND